MKLFHWHISSSLEKRAAFFKIDQYKQFKMYQQITSFHADFCTENLSFIVNNLFIHIL